jgi:uncharacterized protein (UPF0332 family)
MNAREFLDVAEPLIAGMTEAEWRSAVSRAYYAAFHVARGLLDLCGFDVPRAEQAHAYLCRRLENSGHTDVENTGSALNALRKMRNRADYDLDRIFPHPSAAGQVQAADNIIRLLEDVEADPGVRARITDAMKTYERDVLRQVTWHP